MRKVTVVLACAALPAFLGASSPERRMSRREYKNTSYVPRQSGRRRIELHLGNLAGFVK